MRLFRWLGSWVDIIATMCNRFWTLFHGVTLVGYLLLLFVLSFLLEGSWRGDLRECCGELGCLVLRYTWSIGSKVLARGKWTESRRVTLWILP